MALETDIETRRTESKPMQVAEAMRRQIQRGVWPVGERLPSTRQLAVKFETSANTVQSALRLLESQSWIESKPRQRGVVCAHRSEHGVHATQKASQVLLIRPLGSDEDPHLTSTGHTIPGLEMAMADAGMQVTLDSFVPDVQSPHLRALESVDRMGRSLAGVVCFSYRLDESFTQALDRLSIPWIAIGHRTFEQRHNFVAADVFEGARRLGQLLAQLNVHDLLLMPQVSPTMLDVSEQISGLMQGALQASGSPLNCEVLGVMDWREPVGYQALMNHLDNRRSLPQVIFAYSDFTAMGAIRALREKGIDVPGEVGVIGGTGLSVSQFGHPPLAVIAQPMQEIGRQAGAMLLKLIEDKQSRIQGRYLPCALELRESVAVPKELEREVEADNQRLLSISPQLDL